jgi:hypothetical protein
VCQLFLAEDSFLSLVHLVKNKEKIFGENGSERVAWLALAKQPSCCPPFIRFNQTIPGGLYVGSVGK